MARAVELTSAGLPPLAAQNIVGSVANGLTALGTNLATAYLIGSAVNEFTTAAASTGCALPVGSLPGDDIWIINNNTGQTITIYPPTGETVNNAASSVTLATNKNMVLKKVANTKWMSILTA